MTPGLPGISGESTRKLSMIIVAEPVACGTDREHRVVLPAGGHRFPSD